MVRVLDLRQLRTAWHGSAAHSPCGLIRVRPQRASRTALQLAERTLWVESLRHARLTASTRAETLASSAQFVDATSAPSGGDALRNVAAYPVAAESAGGNHPGAVDTVDRHCRVRRQPHRERRLERRSHVEAAERERVAETRRFAVGRDADSRQSVGAPATREAARTAPTLAGAERERSIETETIGHPDDHSTRRVEHVGRPDELHGSAR